MHYICETSRNKLKRHSVSKLQLPFTIQVNCSSDLKIFANSWSSASNFKRFSRSLEEFSLTVRQNKFRNKIPFPNFQRDNLNSTIVPTLIAIMYMTGILRTSFAQPLAALLHLH